MTNVPPFGPLAYGGAVAVPYVVRPGMAPTTSNNEFTVPTIWINPNSSNAWILVAKPLGVADWLMVSASSSTIQTLTGNTGGAISPISSNINIVGDGSVITIAGSPGAATLTASISGTVPVSHGGTGATTLTGVLIGHGTSAITGNTVTQNFALIGASNNGIGSVDPGSTPGVPFVSTGAGTAPAFGTAVVSGGGTGKTSLTAYAVLCGGTTTTNPIQSIASVGTAGQVLTSNGAGALPTFQAGSTTGFNSVVRQVFTSNGTYTPTANMKFADIEVLGGGGGGGGAAATSGTTGASGGGGGGGGYARGVFSAATIGASKTITIGGAGAGGAAGQNNGATGGTTSVGILISATGGVGGNGAAVGSPSEAFGGAGGVGTGGDFQTSGAPGGFGAGYGNVINVAFSGAGGSSFFGGGATSTLGTGTGVAATSYGGGGSGGSNGINSAATAGGNGFAGIVIVTEYIGT